MVTTMTTDDGDVYLEDRMAAADPALADTRDAFAEQVALQLLAYLHARPDYPGFLDEEETAYEALDAFSGVISRALNPRYWAPDDMAGHTLAELARAALKALEDGYDMGLDCVIGYTPIETALVALAETVLAGQGGG